MASLTLPCLRGRLSLASLAFALLAACSGCGGGGSTTTPGNGTGNGGPTPPATTGPTGRVWHDADAGDISNGWQPGTWATAVDSLSTSTFIAPETDTFPWPDGSQFAIYALGTQGIDQLAVKSVATGGELYRVQLQYLAYKVTPSPVSKNVVLTTWQPNLVATQGEFWVIDMATNAFLRQEPTLINRYTYTWLPDGRLLRLQDTTGEIAVATLNGPWQVSGRLSLPPGYKAYKPQVNAQGTRMLVNVAQYDDYYGDTAGNPNDIWVADLDGANFAAITSSKSIYKPFWSPDGQYVAFVHDNSHCWGVGNCTGSCSSWYAPVTARNLDVTKGVDNPLAKEIKRYRPGSTQFAYNIGCQLTGWTQ